MTTGFPAIEALTRQIIAVEAERANAMGTKVNAAVQVCTKLRVPLAKLAGLMGYSSLLNRALALAKSEAPTLKSVQIRPDGSLVGFDEIKHDQAAEASTNGGEVLVAKFLGLLATFIGESLTLCIVRDAWPDASIDDPRI
jgi:hypothetical protein